MNMQLLSDTTRRNWKKLGVKQDFKRLTKRANKKYSKKNIIPYEYFINKENIKYLEEILSASRKIKLETIIYNIAINILNKYKLLEIQKNKIETANEYLNRILKEYEQPIYEPLLCINIPLNEKDFLGCLYQALLCEGVKNIKGSYYTPQSILNDICIKKEDKMLDPCCGTGSFLLNAAEIIDNPENIVGCDTDKIACFIAKINLIVYYRNRIFDPQIYNTDFLEDKKIFKNYQFNIIATNPPWGALKKIKYKKLFPNITSGESYSYFICKSNKYLTENGHCYFILPKSILNISTHKDIRKFILDNFYIKSIKNFGQIFNGVLTDTVLIELQKDKCNTIEFINKTRTKKLSQKYYLKNHNYNFSFIDNKETHIINKIYNREYFTLKDSIWGLGIVTGDNKKHILPSEKQNTEKIYTGKEVEKFFLKNPSKYIAYDRKKYQQTAKEEIYRAKEKLVYKFISPKPIFAYDDTQSLVLNSSNILIPQISDYSVKTVLAFLNSESFEYLYKTIFEDVKILKNNLCQLPFPKIPTKTKHTLENLVDEYLQNRDKTYISQIDNIIYKCFDLNDKEIKIIKKEIQNEK